MHIYVCKHIRTTRIGTTVRGAGIQAGVDPTYIIIRESVRDAREAFGDSHLVALVLALVTMVSRSLCSSPSHTVTVNYFTLNDKNGLGRDNDMRIATQGA